MMSYFYLFKHFVFIDSFKSLYTVTDIGKLILKFKYLNLNIFLLVSLEKYLDHKWAPDILKTKAHKHDL